MEHFGPHAHRVADSGGGHRHDHEFLNVDGVVGMFAAVDDVHHRHRQDTRRGAADIAVQRLRTIVRRRLGRGQRHAQDGIRAQTAFVVGAVQFDHDLVDLDLFGGVDAHQRLGDLAVDGGAGFQHALAHVTRLVAVTLFDRLIGTRGRARWHGSPAHCAVFQDHVDFDGGVATAVENFAGVNVYDGAHWEMSFVLGSAAS